MSSALGDRGVPTTLNLAMVNLRGANAQASGGNYVSAHGKARVEEAQEGEGWLKVGVWPPPIFIL